MGKRFDYFDDPAAPAANSVKPSAAAFVRRGDDILLTCRSDNGNWSMPGGAHDPGESLSETAVRETLEETGINVRADWRRWHLHRSAARHPLHEQRRGPPGVHVVYRAEYVSGEPATSSETTSVEWVPVEQDRGSDDGPQPADAARMGDRSDRHLDRPDRRLTGLRAGRPRPLDEPRHQVIRTVPLTDLVEPILDSDILAARTGGQVGPPKHRMRAARGRLRRRTRRTPTDRSLARRPRANSPSDGSPDDIRPARTPARPGSAPRRADETRCRHVHSRCRAALPPKRDRPGAAAGNKIRGHGGLAAHRHRVPPTIAGERVELVRIHSSSSSTTDLQYPPGRRPVTEPVAHSNIGRLVWRGLVALRYGPSRSRRPRAPTVPRRPRCHHPRVSRPRCRRCRLPL